MKYGAVSPCRPERPALLFPINCIAETPTTNYPAINENGHCGWCGWIPDIPHALPFCKRENRSSYKQANGQGSYKKF